jgi:hypothetical protein
VTRMIVTGLAVLMLVGTGLAQENSDPRDEVVRARAHKMFEEALLKAKGHDLEGAHAMLLRVIEWNQTDEISLKARLEAAKMLARMGKPDEARKLLQGYVDRHGKSRIVPWTKFPGLAEKAKHWNTVLEATLEARKVRRQARQARIVALELEAKAELAEARARLMGEGVAPEEIEKHLKKLHERAAIELKALRDHFGRIDPAGAPQNDLKATSDRPFHSEGPRVRFDEGRAQFEGVWRLLHERGMTEEKARAEAERILAERKAALESFQVAHKHLMELSSLLEGHGPNPAGLADLARKMYQQSLRQHDSPNRFHELLRELVSAVREKRQADVDRLHAEFEKLTRPAPGGDAHWPRPGDGDERPVTRRDGLEERVDRIEKQLDEMRALLEEALRRK